MPDSEIHPPVTEWMKEQILEMGWVYGYVASVYPEIFAEALLIRAITKET
jgi:hypothetical protein